MGTKNWAIHTASILAITLTSGLADAQTAQEPLRAVPPLPSGPQAPPEAGGPTVQGYSVVERPRPEVDPLGIRLGTFFLFPRAEADAVYNDNIFATNTFRKSDFIAIARPSVDLLSNFPRHALNLHSGLALGRYADHSSENFLDGFGAMDGRIDVTDAYHFTGGIRAERLHEDRTSPDAPGAAAKPVKYNAYTGNVGFAEDAYRIGYGIDGAVRREEYESAPLVGGGRLLQSQRNLWSYEAAPQASYEFIPNYRGFVRTAVNYRDYDHAAFGSPSQNSWGFRTDVGARVNITGLIYGEGYVGYLRQQYNSSALGTISGVDFGANLVWNVTELTSLKFGGARSVQDANVTAVGTPNSPGYLHSEGTFNIDHELLRQLLLNGHAGIANDDFKGIDRSDMVYGAGVGAKYLANRYLYLGLTYDVQHRDSSGKQSTGNFTQNIVMLRVSTQF